MRRRARSENAPQLPAAQNGGIRNDHGAAAQPPQADGPRRPSAHEEVRRRLTMDLLIFDLDGTLIDSKLDLAHAVNATRAHMGQTPLEHERVYSYVGNGAPVLIRRALGPEATEP